MTIKAAFDQGKRNRPSSLGGSHAAPAQHKKKVGFFRGWTKKGDNGENLLSEGESSAMVQTAPEVGADKKVTSPAFKKRKSMVDPGAQLEVSKLGELGALTLAVHVIYV